MLVLAPNQHSSRSITYDQRGCSYFIFFFQTDALLRENSLSYLRSLDFLCARVDQRFGKKNIGGLPAFLSVSCPRLSEKKKFKRHLPFISIWVFLHHIWICLFFDPEFPANPLLLEYNGISHLANLSLYLLLLRP